LDGTIFKIQDGEAGLVQSNVRQPEEHLIVPFGLQEHC